MVKNRQTLIKAIHTGRRYLQLDEETYRAFLHDVTRKNSCVLMDTPELEKVLACMREKGSTAQKQNFKDRQDRLFKDSQYRKCYSLWQELHELGGIKNNSPFALNSYLKKICPTFRLKFVIAEGEFQRAIEILKSWIDRIDPEIFDDKTQQQIQELLFPDEVGV